MKCFYTFELVFLTRFLERMVEIKVIGVLDD